MRGYVVSPARQPPSAFANGSEAMSSTLEEPSVYIGIFSEQFGVDPNTAAGLINYPNLAFGFGSLVLVPLYRKIGRRPVMLMSMVLYAAGPIGASQATTYAGLMGARVVHAFGSGVCEALPVQLVNDVFFLHERGKRIGYYTCRARHRLLSLRPVLSRSPGAPG